METTISLEFFSETKEHLKTLEQQLKHEHDVDVDLLVPKDATAPVLIAIGIKKHGERAEKAAQRVAHRRWREEQPLRGPRHVPLLVKSVEDAE